MQVILLERVEKLGHMGQVVNVKAGYARNFLLPKKKALRATKQNLDFFEHKRVEFEATNLKRKSEAEVVAGKMEGTMINLIRQASEMGHLYGSVRSADVVQGLEELGFKVGRGQVQIDVPIKFLGMHQVRVLLHPEVSVSINVNVAQSEEEAAVQALAKTKGEEVSATPIEAAFGETEGAASQKAASAKKKETAPKKSKTKASEELLDGPEVSAAE